MSQLTIHRAKPNPAGRDTFHHIPLARQLQGEWVDIINTSGMALRLQGVSLDHTAFGPNCADPKNAVYWPGSSGLDLGSGEILRVHTGRYADSGQMADEDRNGAHKHAWAEHGSFKLNNGACGDSLAIWFNDGQWHAIDRASYAPYPPEGVVLVREGMKLVVPVRSYAGYV